MDHAPPAVPEKPLLKPWYRLAVDDGKVVLEYAQSAVVFDGAAAARLLPSLLPLLDGEHAVDEIAAELGEAARPALDNALQLLARHRLLTSAFDGDAPRAETAQQLAASYGGSPGEVARAVATARVAVAGERAADVAQALRCAGLESVEEVRLAASVAADLAIVAPSGTELPMLPAWNDRCLATSTPWLVLLPYDGRMATIGPLFVPPDTACYDCFRTRRASVSGYAEEFWSVERARADYPDAVPIRQAVAGLAAWVVLGWLVGRDASLPGTFYAVEPRGRLSVAAHEVGRVPRCPSCSDAAGTAPPSPWFDGALR